MNLMQQHCRREARNLGFDPFSLLAGRGLFIWLGHFWLFGEKYMETTRSIPIRVNGSPGACQEGQTILEFLQERKLDTDRVVVERNGAIVPVESYGLTGLYADDTLEIIHFVGGG